MKCDRCKRRSTKTNPVLSREYPLTGVRLPKPTLKEGEVAVLDPRAYIAARQMYPVCQQCHAAGWQALYVLLGFTSKRQPLGYHNGYGQLDYRVETNLSPDSGFHLYSPVTDVFRRIVDDFLWLLEGNRKLRTLEMVDYHGFSKVRLPEDVVEAVTQMHGKHSTDVQAELVAVHTDLSHEIHLHRNSCAYNVVLGKRDGFPNAKGAKVFLRDRWLDIRAGDQVEIPHGTTHGFTVKPGGLLYFLSVQTPPIVSTEGEDDYVPATTAA
ncbi:MAG: hypothetical protein JWL82_133 [Parcubacteria group bacterium]|nr:hypothetical protein [Parcubacteria group bacterium]